MPAHDEARPHALGAGGADVVLAHHLEQRGAHHAGGDRGVAIADRGGGPDRHGQVGDRVLPERHVADLGQPVEQRQQRQNDQHAQPERRDGKARDRHHPHDVIDPGVAVKRRDGAEGDGDEHGDEARHQGDLEGDRHADGDLLGDRLAGPQRLAEVEAGEAGHVVEELRVERLVEPQALALGLDRLLGDGGAVGAQLHHHDVAGHHTDEEEHGDGNADQRRDHQE